MALIEDIHRQPAHIRTLLWGLSVFVTLAVAGYFWFSAVEREMFAALHDDPEERAAFVAAQDARTPETFAVIGRAFGSLVASIGNLIGIDSQEGFDRPAPQDTVYPLPLSD